MESDQSPRWGLEVNDTRNAPQHQLSFKSSRVSASTNSSTVHKALGRQGKDQSLVIGSGHKSDPKAFRVPSPSLQRTSLLLRPQVTSSIRICQVNDLALMESFIAAPDRDLRSVGRGFILPNIS